MRRPKQRVDFMVDALAASSKVGTALNSIQLRSCRPALKALVKDAREAQRSLVDLLEEAIAMDVPVPPKVAAKIH